TATDGRDPSIVKNKKSTRIATSQSSDPFRKKRFDTTKTQSGHCSITSSPGASNDGGTIEAKRASI
ncbi:MAG: hypothetical protein WAM72_19650, partial [Xanthobacteraceae bacterium]